MAGYSDKAFRLLLRKLGVKITFSEMIASQALIRKNQRTLKMLKDIDKEPGLCIQLFGSDPYVMSEAAKILADMGAQHIDINMGCPQKKIVKTGAGAALMKDLTLAAKVVRSVKQAVSIPVSVKMRLGWDKNSLVAASLAKICEQEGAGLVTVHARTKTQMFSGHACWAAVKPVRESVSIPVIVNGDIVDPETCKKSLEESQADGVMIGRGALGRPWIFNQIETYLRGGKTAGPDIKSRLNIALLHIDLIKEVYPGPEGQWISRKQIVHYSHGLKGAAQFRKELYQTTGWDRIISLLSSLFAKNV